MRFNPIRIIPLIMVLFSAIAAAKAQDPHYRHFTFESGVNLPSNEVYGILFDKSHVLWATTDRGIWRYDGDNGTQITANQGLLENKNTGIFTGPDGSVWVSSINNCLSRIEGDSARQFEANRDIRSVAGSGEYIRQVVIRPDSSALISFNKPGLFHIRSGEQPARLTGHIPAAGHPLLAIHCKPGDFYWDILRPPDSTGNVRSEMTRQGDWFYLDSQITDGSGHLRTSFFPLDDGSFLLSLVKRLFVIRQGILIREKAFEREIISLYAGSDGSIWVGLDSRGVLRFPHGNLDAEPIRYLGGETVTGIAVDYQGSCWFSTLNNGIYQAMAPEVPVYRVYSPVEHDNIITALTVIGNSVYAGSQTGRLFKALGSPNGSYRLMEINLPVYNGPIRDLERTPGQHLMVLNGFAMEIDTLGHPKGLGIHRHYCYDYSGGNGPFSCASRSGNIDFFRDGRLIGRWDRNEADMILKRSQGLADAISRVRCLYREPGGRLWLGTEASGLFSVEDSTVTTWSAHHAILGKRIQDITGAGRYTWISVADAGIVVLGPDSTFYRITTKEGLSSDIIDVLFAENDSVVWAGTNNGLNRISFSPSAPIPVQVVHFNTSEGLPSDRIYGIDQMDGFLWIATSRGIARLPKGFGPRVIRPQTGTCRISVNGRQLKLRLEKPLAPDMNNLLFNFSIVNYLDPASLVYRYKIDGIDQDYIISRVPEARYPDLSHGTYTFRYNATFNGQFDPGTEKSITFQIRRNWYETPLALVCYLLLFAGLSLLIFKTVVKLIRLREDEKRRMLKAEKRSLLAQMNPHFIFNSLNSIQHFIIQHDEIQATNYLSSFSGLIRTILDNSRKNMIPLSEEISALSLYLGMEKLRFENEFRYEIVKDPGIDYLETHIPPMLLQPFVENAIWHGLLPLKAPGKLVVTFSDFGDCILCRIEDNGIGREKALTIRRKPDLHISNGIRNVEERIDLLNRMNRKKITLKITDLRNMEGTGSGTLVELFLPKELKF